MAAEVKQLRRWNQLTRFLEYLIWTGQVANGRPMSAILASEPGEGKTELLDRFKVNSLLLAYYSDLTYRTVIDILKNRVARAQVTHVVCSEFQKVMARRRSVSESTCMIMLQSMEEGVGKVAFGPQVHDCHGARAGWLLATTMTHLSRNPYIITEIAMDSRAYLIDATATKEELGEIERRVAEGDMSALKPVALKKLPLEQKVEVEIPPPIANRVRLWVREMEQKHVPVYGVRTFSRFLHTLRGVTLAHGRTKATTTDEEELYGFRNLWLLPPSMTGISENNQGRG